MPFRAGKPTGRPIPRRLIFTIIYNDLRGMVLLVGLIFMRHDMALTRGKGMPARTLRVL